MLIKLFDIIFSFIFLILLLPLFVLISLTILLESKGGIFYSQKRIGLKGKEFNLFKFRTMYAHSDKKGYLTIGMNDKRITRAGIILRKYKLDELPQLLNVLIGNMSIVGPRPEVKKYVDLYTDEQKKILNVKPGITDYASIIFFNENEILSKSTFPEQTYINEIMPYKLKLNIIFIDNYNIKTYLKIIFLTLTKIINSFGKN